MRRVILAVLGAGLLGGGVAVWRVVAPGMDAAAAGPVVPSTVVRRGDLSLDVRLTGDLKAIREVSLSAPAVGGTLRILKVVDTGTPVTAGDVIMEFDPAEQQYAMDQALSEVREAEQEIIKRQADAEVATAQDQVALLTAKFDVRRAELDAVIGQDLIGANAFRIRQVSLEEARRRLVQVTEDARSRTETNRAALAVLEEKRAKAQLSADRARQNMESLQIIAPMDGIVSVRENNDMGGMIIMGVEAPAYRVGDSTFSGRPVVDVLDVSGMEVRARVNEQERVNVTVGQKATVRFDGVAGLALPATVTVVSGMGRPDRTAGPLRMFDVTLRLDETDPRLRPRTSVRVIATGQTIEGVLLVPRQSIFDQDGKSIAYVSTPAGFEVREITVLHRNESQAAVEGLEEGTVVALVDPSTAMRAGPAASGGDGR